jgi:hypothetical protein
MTARKATRRGPQKARTGPLNRGQEWTAREVRVLERYYGRIPRKELLSRYLPERTLNGVEHRARLLGLTTPRAPVYPWKAEDLAVLRRYYGTMPNHELRDRFLPQASVPAIRHRARRLGLRSKEPDWSAEENRLLKRYYGHMSNPELVRLHLPRRTADTVQGHAAKLGLTHKAFDAWTAQELRLLRMHYPTHTLPELARYFPGRTASAIRTRVGLEGLQKSPPAARWTKRELALIQRHYEAKDGLDTLVRKLDRTRLSIQQQARKLGMSRAGNPWTASDDALLRRLYPVHGRHSHIPGHTPGSIRERARKLGLRRSLI